MFYNENMRKITKILLVAFLCCEMQYSSTERSISQSKGNEFEYLNTFNGSFATRESAKYQASIRLLDLDEEFGEGHICSGALIAPSVVITIAQCLFNYSKATLRHPAELKVVMGTLNRYEPNEYTLIYGATHIFRANHYNHRLNSDVAVIMLERDIPADHPTVKPIHFSNMAENNESALRMASWCASNSFEMHSTTAVPLMLFNATKEVEFNNRQQQQTMESFGMVHLNAKPTFCSIDAGSPLIYQNKLVGLVAYHTDLSTESSVIYTNVGQHSAWIWHKIGNGTNQNSSLWGILGFLGFTIYTLKCSKGMKL